MPIEELEVAAAEPASGSRGVYPRLRRRISSETPQTLRTTVQSVSEEEAEAESSRWRDRERSRRVDVLMQFLQPGPVLQRQGQFHEMRS